MNDFRRPPFDLFPLGGPDFVKRFDDMLGGVSDMFESEKIFNFAPFANFRTDIKDEETQYVLEIDLPGVEKGNIEVNYKDNSLIVKAKRLKEEEKNETYLKRERYVGEFVRKYTLENADPKGISANFKNGVLTIVVPKLQEPKNEGLKINIS